MAEVLHHRGPDDSGVWSDPSEGVAFGFQRLAILDLSPAGHQPVVSRDESHVLVFNGEIYNHRVLRDAVDRERGGHAWRGHSDTETLVEAISLWGVDEVLVRCVGMFAFAVWDRETRLLTLARDRAGEKPLFYSVRGRRLAFASELKALMVNPEIPREVDRTALDYYLAFGYVPRERCILRDVRKLPPAHRLRFSPVTGVIDSAAYWQLPEVGDCDLNVEESEAVERLEALLSDSVRRQLVADVPVGIMLSGGVDSSLVTAVAAKVSDRPIKTFTVTFPGHEHFDEAPHARLIADHFSTDHTELRLDAPTADLIPQLAMQFDEPMCDSSMVPYHLVSKKIREHAAVALGGDGGDELFGGYWHYGWLLQQDRLRQCLPAGLRRAMAWSASRFVPPGIRGRNYLLGLAGDSRDGAARVNLRFDAVTRCQLLGHTVEHPDGMTPETYKQRLVPPAVSIVQQATRMDFHTYMADDILVKVDRASMLTSLEVRAPFLDRDLIEYAFRLPDGLRAARGKRKILLRALASKMLPKTFDSTRKQGFSIPLDAWFRSEWGKEMKGMLLSGEGRLFEKKAVRELIRGQEAGRRNAERLFSLVLAEYWMRGYQIAD